jgi:hypothetical protein
MCRYSLNVVITCGVILLSGITLGGCEALAIHDGSSLLILRFARSETDRASAP